MSNPADADDEGHDGGGDGVDDGTLPAVSPLTPPPSPPLFTSAAPIAAVNSPPVVASHPPSASSTRRKKPRNAKIQRGDMGTVHLEGGAPVTRETDVRKVLLPRAMPFWQWTLPDPVRQFQELHRTFRAKKYLDMATNGFANGRARMEAGFSLLEQADILLAGNADGGDGSGAGGGGTGSGGSGHAAAAARAAKMRRQAHAFIQQGKSYILNMSHSQVPKAGKLNSCYAMWRAYALVRSYEVTPLPPLCAVLDIQLTLVTPTAPLLQQTRLAAWSIFRVRDLDVRFGAGESAGGGGGAGSRWAALANVELVILSSRTHVDTSLHLRVTVNPWATHHCRYEAMGQLFDTVGALPALHAAWVEDASRMVSICGQPLSQTKATLHMHQVNPLRREEDKYYFLLMGTATLCPNRLALGKAVREQFHAAYPLDGAGAWAAGHGQYLPPAPPPPASTGAEDTETPLYGNVTPRALAYRNAVLGLLKVVPLYDRPDQWPARLPPSSAGPVFAEVPSFGKCLASIHRHMVPPLCIAEPGAPSADMQQQQYAWAPGAVHIPARLDATVLGDVTCPLELEDVSSGILDAMAQEDMFPLVQQRASVFSFAVPFDAQDQSIPATHRALVTRVANRRDTSVLYYPAQVEDVCHEGGGRLFPAGNHLPLLDTSHGAVDGSAKSQHWTALHALCALVTKTERLENVAAQVATTEAAQQLQQQLSGVQEAFEHEDISRSTLKREVQEIIEARAIRPLVFWEEGLTVPRSSQLLMARPLALAASSSADTGSGLGAMSSGGAAAAAAGLFQDEQNYVLQMLRRSAFKSPWSLTPEGRPTPMSLSLERHKQLGLPFYLHGYPTSHAQPRMSSTLVGHIRSESIERLRALLQHALFQLSAPANAFQLRQFRCQPYLPLPAEARNMPLGTSPVGFGLFQRDSQNRVKFPQVHGWATYPNPFGRERDQMRWVAPAEIFFPGSAPAVARMGLPMGPFTLDPLFGEPGHVPTEAGYAPERMIDILGVHVEDLPAEDRLRLVYRNVWVVRTNAVDPLGQMTDALQDVQANAAGAGAGALSDATPWVRVVQQNLFNTFGLQFYFSDNARENFQLHGLLTTTQALSPPPLSVAGAPSSSPPAPPPAAGSPPTSVAFPAQEKACDMRSSIMPLSDLADHARRHVPSSRHPQRQHEHATFSPEATPARKQRSPDPSGETAPTASITSPHPKSPSSAVQAATSTAITQAGDDGPSVAPERSQKSPAKTIHPMMENDPYLNQALAPNAADDTVSRAEGDDNSYLHNPGGRGGGLDDDDIQAIMAAAAEAEAEDNGDDYQPIDDNAVEHAFYNAPELALPPPRPPTSPPPPTPPPPPPPPLPSSSSLPQELAAAATTKPPAVVIKLTSTAADRLRPVAQQTRALPAFPAGGGIADVNDEDATIVNPHGHVVMRLPSGGGGLQPVPSPLHAGIEQTLRRQLQEQEQQQQIQASAPKTTDFVPTQQTKNSHFFPPPATRRHHLPQYAGGLDLGANGALPPVVRMPTHPKPLED